MHKQHRSRRVCVNGPWVTFLDISPSAAVELFVWHYCMFQRVSKAPLGLCCELLWTNEMNWSSYCFIFFVVVQSASVHTPKGRHGRSVFMGCVLRLLVLSGANKPSYAQRLVSLQLQSELEIDLCLVLRFFLCACWCLLEVLYVCSYSSGTESLCVCWCYLCNWI